jgi:hypothetical protein
MTIPWRKKKNGRPRLSVNELRSAMIRTRCTLAEEEKYKLLGGNSWLREALKRARLPGQDPLKVVASSDAEHWAEVKALVKALAKAVAKPRRRSTG